MSCRQDGGVTCHSLGADLPSAKPERRCRIRSISPGSSSMPARRARRSRPKAQRRPCRPARHRRRRPRPARPPHSSRISRVAHARSRAGPARGRGHARSGCGHRSRCRAGGRWRRCAADRTAPPRAARRWSSASTPVLSPPMMPPRLTGPLASAITVMPSSRTDRCCRPAPAAARPAAAKRSTISPCSLAASNTCSGRHRSKVR